MIIHIIELLGTFAFAISGIRHAAAKQFDWFGGYVCGVAVAIGGGTIRDVMLGTTPFWMTTPIYLICTAVALLTVAFFGKWMEPLKNAWFVFDTFGLALFTIAGIQKSLFVGQPFWVAIVMGCITGAAGGVMRDVLINEVPLIFRKEIYAIACINHLARHHIVQHGFHGYKIMIALVFRFEHAFPFGAVTKQGGISVRLIEVLEDIADLTETFEQIHVAYRRRHDNRIL